MYTPNRSPLTQNNRPVGGDRFIPTRSLMDMDYARSIFSHWTPFKKSEEEEEPLNPTPKDEYRRRIKEHFKVDSEGKPRKMLAFGTPNRCQKKLSFDHPFQDELPVTRSTKPLRHVPTSPTLMLDAPYIKDDPCLKLLDWGKENIIAIALGFSVYLYKYDIRATQNLLETSDDSDDYPSSLAWSEDGRLLAVGFATSRIEIWDALKLHKIQTIEEHSGRVGALSWNNNHTLSSGCHDGLIINHDVRLKEGKATKYNGHEGEICGLSWSEDGGRLASSGKDGTVLVWDRAYMSRTSKYLHRFRDHIDSVRALAWCPFKSHTLATGGGPMDRSIKIWNTQIGNCTTSFDSCSQVGALEWNRHQKEILSAQDNKLSLRSFSSMREIVELKGHSERVLHLCQSPDGTTAASASADETLRFWNVFGPPSKKRDDDGGIFSLKRTHIR